MEVLERMPFTAQKKIFERLAEIADSSCLSKEEREKYDESQKAADDWYSGMYGSWKEGKAEGIAEGIEKGDTNRGLADAKRFLDMGFSPEQVAQGTQLPLDTILTLVGKA